MLGGPVQGVAVILMLAVLIVLNAVRLRRTGSGPFPVVATTAAVVGVLVVIGLVLAVGDR